MTTTSDPALRDVAVVMRWVGYGMLILALPIALFAVTMLPNEYEAMGFGGVDCDGPLHVFMLAGPAYLIYSIAAVINAFGFRRQWNRVISILCMLVCVAITPNFVAALEEQRDNDTHHLCE